MPRIPPGGSMKVTLTKEQPFFCGVFCRDTKIYQVNGSWLLEDTIQMKVASYNTLHHISLIVIQLTTSLEKR